MKGDLATTATDATELLNEVVEAVWKEMEGQVARERVRQIVFETADSFSGATVTAFLPVLIRRQVRERLLSEKV